MDQVVTSATEVGTPAREATLSPRALNRATLARQMLLRREQKSALETLEFLLGMQAQVPRAPYVGLWSRLEGFQAAELAELMTSRQAVRAPLMRATIHMASARDCLAFWPLMQPVLERNLFTGSPFGRNLKGMDISELLAAGRALIEEQPRSTAELKALLGEQWPDRDGASLAYAINHLLPVVQVTPRGLWTESSQTKWTTTDAWLGQPIDPEPSMEQMILRYLAAFGPASIADIQSWSSLTRLRDVVERLRPRLRSFRNEQGKEFFDLPDAPRPDPETHVPVRFLPVYDNLFLAHADRSRFFASDTTVPPIPGNGRDTGSILVDGFFRGVWNIKRERNTAVLQIEAFPGLPQEQTPEVLAEGERLLAFAGHDAQDHPIAFVTF